MCPGTIYMYTCIICIYTHIYYISYIYIYTNIWIYMICIWYADDSVYVMYIYLSTCTWFKIGAKAPARAMELFILIEVRRFHPERLAQFSINCQSAGPGHGIVYIDWDIYVSIVPDAIRKFFINCHNLFTVHSPICSRSWLGSSGAARHILIVEHYKENNRKPAGPQNCLIFW